MADPLTAERLAKIRKEAEGKWCPMASLSPELFLKLDDPEQLHAFEQLQAQLANVIEKQKETMASWKEDIERLAAAQAERDELAQWKREFLHTPGNVMSWQRCIVEPSPGERAKETLLRVREPDPWGELLSAARIAYEVADFSNYPVTEQQLGDAIAAVEAQQKGGE